MSTIEVNKITPISGGSTVTLGNSGDTFNLASGATAGFGKIGQIIVSRTISNINITADGSYVDTGVTATITPTSTSSKILVIPAFCYLIYQQNADNRLGTNLRIVRGSTAVETWGNDAGTLADTGLGTYNYSTSQPVGLVNIWTTVYEDSPNTTSATTFKIQASNISNKTQIGCQHQGKASTMTLMEVLA